MNGTMKSAVLVLGATGGIGRGVVEALLAARYPVLAVARDGERLAGLKQRFEGAAGLELLPGSVADDTVGAALATTVRQRRRPLAGIVACLGGRLERGRLLDQPTGFLRRKLDEDLLPHLVAARNLLPLLAQDERIASYLLIGGPGAEHPWAGYGHASVAAAALRMFAQALHDEARPQSVRVRLLSVAQPVRTERNQACACPEWPSALEVGARVVEQLQADARCEPVLRIDRRRERIVIPALHAQQPPEKAS